MNIQIRGSKWKLVLLTDEGFNDKMGADFAGVCVVSDRTIYFVESEINLPTVVHELVHAYYHETHTSSAELTPHQIEEVFADLFAIHGNDMLKLGRRVLKWLKTEVKDL